MLCGRKETEFDACEIHREAGVLKIYETFFLLQENPKEKLSILHIEEVLLYYIENISHNFTNFINQVELLNGIRTETIKEHNQQILAPSNVLINTSFKLGKFPNYFKL